MVITMSKKILEVDDLRTYFYTKEGIVKAVDGVSFDVGREETLAIVGESGSGKTVTALSILRVIPPTGKISAKKIVFNGENLLDKTEEEMQRIRGKEMAIVFQDPTSSFNPVLTIERQLTEIIMHHNNVSKEEAKKKAVELLKIVGIPDAEMRIKEYPHQFSGGMKQRVAIARALSCEPKLLFADEPTTALDVTIQAEVLGLIKDLKKKFGMSVVMITHDMGIVAEIADRVVVLYSGKVCEIAETEELFTHPRHPYTYALLQAAPRVDVHRRPEAIPGEIPNPINPPTGCRFHPRDKYAIDICAQREPVLEEVKPGHYVACHRWREINLTVR
jgi:peptide/nickel transport system ATP-binding protein